jgi:3-hydroxyisobutyrate dehydrogenase-like beta-hydroxyacid dehydrogenase
MLPDERATNLTRLGFIGLGFLGSRIAGRILAAGFPMVVYDSDIDKAKALGARGATVARHPDELAAEVDIVLSCLPSEAAVEAVYAGDGGVFQNVRRGTRIIELSTIAPETIRRLHEAARRRDIFVLDVSVSGSTLAAEAGALTLFGGGERNVFEASEPIFAAIAKQWFYIGPSGSGLAMKLVVNTLLGLGMQAIAEAVALGRALDLPRDLLLDTLAKTAVIAPAFAGKMVSAKQHDYTPQFPVRLMHKDFRLVLAAAARAGLDLPATESAAAVNAAEAASGGEEDFSAVVRRMERQAELAPAGPPAI